MVFHEARVKYEQKRTKNYNKTVDQDHGRARNQINYLCMHRLGFK